MTMPPWGCCFSMAPYSSKHKHLVEDCYAVIEGKIVLQSAKLSSLIHYINSRPEKLFKITSYLTDKAQKDFDKCNDRY